MSETQQVKLGRKKKPTLMKGPEVLISCYRLNITQ